MTNYTIEQLDEMVREVNAYDGTLEHFEYDEMERINEIFCDIEPLEILRMAHFGDFNWNDEMFRINVYGNLESCSEDYYITELDDNKDEIIERYNELVEDNSIEKLF